MAKDGDLRDGGGGFDKDGRAVVPLHPDDLQLIEELEAAKARGEAGVGIEGKLIVGAEEAVDALRDTMKDRSAPHRDRNSAAEKVLTAAKIGGFDKTRHEDNRAVAFLFSDPSQVKGLMDGMAAVAGSLSGSLQPAPSAPPPSPPVSPAFSVATSASPDSRPPSSPSGLTGGSESAAPVDVPYEEVPEDEPGPKPRPAEKAEYAGVSKTRLAAASRAVHKKRVAS